MKKISWCWRTENLQVVRVTATGTNITDAFTKLRPDQQDLAINNVKWFEVNGVRQ